MNMTMYTTRLFQNEADYRQMRGLLREGYRLAGHLAYLTVGDLDWWRNTTNDPAVLSKVRLWFHQTGKLVSFIWPGDNQIDLTSHPHHRELEVSILDWVEAEYARRLGKADEPSDFQVWCYEQDGHRQRLLHDRGYVRGTEYLALHSYPLDQPLASRSLPAGYTLRTFAGEAEIEARVNVHRAAFHPSRMTVEKHRQVMASSTYRPDLDLVVVAPNGDLAAYTIVWWDGINDMGLFEPVGCHPDHQRRGLASAVLCEGMRRLRDLDATIAHVNSWREDSPGAYTYRAVGFTITDRIYAWKKRLTG
jgi:ribosomal protein S18 acetylase RimI-like enzyme